MLSLVRWYNILTVVLAQYLASIFILNSNQNWIITLFDINLHLVILSSGLIIASGFIINSFYDLERDVITAPKRVVFNRLVSQQTCLNFYFLFNTIGMILSYQVSKRIMLFNFLFSIALWFYSHKLKKQAFLGNLSATALAIAPFCIIIVYYDDINYAIFFYVAFIAIIDLIREIIKDIIAQKADIVLGYKSIPVQFGLVRTKRLLYTLMLLSIAPPVLLYFTYNVDVIVIYFLLSSVLILISAVWLNRATETEDFVRVFNIYKTIILIGIFSIMLV